MGIWRINAYRMANQLLGRQMSFLKISYGIDPVYNASGDNWREFYKRRTMEPGQELDDLIIKHVIGPENVITVSDGNCHRPPSYSLSISAAWQVVEKMDSKCAFKMGRDLNKPDSKWANPKGPLCFAEFRSIDGGQHYAVSKTAPHAICLAALKAKGIEV